MHRGLYKFLTVMGGKFECQVQDSDLEYSFWQCEKHIPLSEKKKPPLIEQDTIENVS